MSLWLAAVLFAVPFWMKTMNIAAYKLSLCFVAVATVVNGGAGSIGHFLTQMYFLSLVLWIAVAVL